MKSNRRSSWRENTGLARNSAALMLLVILGTGRVWAGNNDWTSIGPFGGGIQALAIDPQSPTTLYAGTGGGVFKSTNGGISWSASNSGLPGAVAILAIDPQSPNTVYAACTANNSGIFKSTDGGAHWSPINSGLEDSVIVVDSLAVDPQNPGTVYAGAFACFQPSGSPGFVPGGENLCWRPGVFKTTNGGASWTGASTGLPWNSVSYGSFKALAVDPRNSSTVYAAAAPGGVYRTTDGGASWTHLALQQASALVIDPQNPSTIYAAAYGGITKTIDGGASWSAAGLGLSTDCCGSLAIDKRNPATMYAGGSAYSASVYKTSDGGGHWSAAAPVPAVNPSISANLGNFGVMGLAVDPQNPGVVYAATGSQGVVKSTDQANSWSVMNHGLPAAPVYTVAVDSQNAGTIYAGSYVLFKTSDGGANWNASSHLPGGGAPNSIAIDPQAPSTLYAGASGPWGYYSICDDCDTQRWPAGVFKSMDGGASWISIGPDLEPGTFTASLAIDPHDPRTIYAGGFSPNHGPGLISEILKSVNGGASWKTIGSFPSYVRAVVIDSQSPGNLYVVAGGWIFKSTDGGESWKDLQVPGGAGDCDECLGLGVLAIDPQRPDTLYAGGYAGVSRSTDGGASWKMMSSGLPLPPIGFTGVNALAVDPHDSNIAYATIDGRVFRSADGAATWSEVNAGMTVTGARTLTFDPTNSGTVYAGTASGGIFAITFVP